MLLANKIRWEQICVLRKETTRSSFSSTPGRGSISAAAGHSIEQQQELINNLNDVSNLAALCDSAQDSAELKKIKKVQSFFRGWLCRRRWKQIVEEYIKSPHAESMRKRNSLVFSMVEAEEEYLEQLEVILDIFSHSHSSPSSSLDKFHIKFRSKIMWPNILVTCCDS